jgi:DNA-binding protein H-NS
MKLTNAEVDAIRCRVNSHIAEYPNIGGDMPDLLDTIADLERQLTEARAEAAAALEKAATVAYQVYDRHEGHFCADESRIKEAVLALITKPQSTALAQHDDALFAPVLDVLDKYSRGSPFERNTKENLAAVLDKILRVDARNVQEKQEAESALATAKRELAEFARVKAEARLDEARDHLKAVNDIVGTSGFRGPNEIAEIFMMLTERLAALEAAAKEIHGS